jgi:ADP-ribosylglycohydrolase
MRLVLTDDTRLGYALDSLTGLSTGDALGAQYFMVGRRVEDLIAGVVPPPVWDWTDDTEMACSVVWMLVEAGQIDQDRLATAFAQRCDIHRGYGVGAYTILSEIRTGTPWRQAAAAVFDGQGSHGNGAAMRVAPLGAYFAGAPDRAAAEAARSAEVTHLHPEGVTGAVAVAVAASVAAAARLSGQRPSFTGFLDAVLEHVQPGQVLRYLRRARRLRTATVEAAADELGSGTRITAVDTVPFTVWAAARWLDDYPAAVRACVLAGGDIDTTSAIVGGIVAAFTGRDGVPADWVRSREPLPDWLSSAGVAGVG